MTIQPLFMPKLGMEMTEGIIAKWNFQDGAEIQKGDEVFDVETEKLVTPYESEFSGSLRVLGEEGHIYQVGDIIGAIAEAGVSEADIDAFLRSNQVEGDESGSVNVEDDEAKDVQVQASEAQDDLDEARPNAASEYKPAAGEVSPVAERFARKHSLDLSEVTGTGRLGRISLADAKAIIPQDRVSDASEVKASPVARRMAALRKVSLSDVSGTGPKGRILKRDIESFVPIGRARQNRANFVSTPLSPMRKTIAKRLVESKQTAPHIYLRASAQIDGLLKVRADINADLKDEKVSINDFIIKATANALRDTPHANVQFHKGEVRTFDQADVCVAIAIEGGLVSPVIGAACQKNLLDISREIRDLAKRAKNRRLVAEDLAGGTITVSNLGMYGTRDFDAVINPPQSMIVAVGAVGREAIESEQGVSFVSSINITVSCDHRVIDGAVGAEFLQALKANLEAPYRFML